MTVAFSSLLDDAVSVSVKSMFFEIVWASYFEMAHILYFWKGNFKWHDY